eukprot:Hpha_TRINITY_DN17003_c3_g8::TRINITY_DN17003_c3_g8_i1::g.166154::m.166154
MKCGNGTQPMWEGGVLLPWGKGGGIKLLTAATIQLGNKRSEQAGGGTTFHSPPALKAAPREGRERKGEELRNESSHPPLPLSSTFSPQLPNLLPAFVVPPPAPSLPWVITGRTEVAGEGGKRRDELGLTVTPLLKSSPDRGSAPKSPVPRLRQVRAFR